MMTKPGISSDRDTVSGSATPAWIPSTRFEDAVLYAIRTHALQARKGGAVPYLTHLFGVASLVIEDGGTEDETIAALLHDAVEDQGGDRRARDIGARFGTAVADMVVECSDSTELPKQPWEERKGRYVDSLASASSGAIRVSLADKIHNARSMAADYAQIQERLWERFSVTTRKPHENYYRSLREAFHAAGASPWLLGQFDVALVDLFPPLFGTGDNAQLHRTEVT